MWVRSQDKLKFFNAQGFKTEHFDAHNLFVIHALVDGAYREIAQYHSESQLDSVLFDIQNVINEQCPFVYQMPEDNENKEEE